MCVCMRDLSKSMGKILTCKGTLKDFFYLNTERDVR